MTTECSFTATWLHYTALLQQDYTGSFTSTGLHLAALLQQDNTRLLYCKRITQFYCNMTTPCSFAVLCLHQAALLQHDYITLLYCNRTILGSFTATEQHQAAFQQLDNTMLAALLQKDCTMQLYYNRTARGIGNRITPGTFTALG